MCVEEQQAMLADDLIHRWQFITDQMMCKEKSKMDWTDELHFKFADVVESLGGIKGIKIFFIFIFSGWNLKEL